MIHKIYHGDSFWWRGSLTLLTEGGNLHRPVNVLTSYPTCCLIVSTFPCTCYMRWSFRRNFTHCVPVINNVEAKRRSLLKTGCSSHFSRQLQLLSVFKADTLQAIDNRQRRTLLLLLPPLTGNCTVRLHSVHYQTLMFRLRGENGNLYEEMKI